MNCARICILKMAAKAQQVNGRILLSFGTVISFRSRWSRVLRKDLGHLLIMARSAKLSSSLTLSILSAGMFLSEKHRSGVCWCFKDLYNYVTPYIADNISTTCTHVV